jgi:hypothetical protein
MALRRLVVEHGGAEKERREDRGEGEHRTPDRPDPFGDTGLPLHAFDALTGAVDRYEERDEEKQEPGEDGEHRDPRLNGLISQVAPGLVVDLVVPHEPVDEQGDESEQPRAGRAALLVQLTVDVNDCGHASLRETVSPGLPRLQPRPRLR